MGLQQELQRLLFRCRGRSTRWCSEREQKTSTLCIIFEKETFLVTGKSKARRVKTIYDCQADNDDELTFVEGEVIIVTGEEDQEWWIGHIEGDPERKGVFPMSFVHILSD
ncbi:hypothetical protein INR49_012014 [Caranx melampygus]|nr:hypothetical protein INR49_012014 [Caranx melampygus]